ncbi:MAG: hypothetical protein ACJAUG_001302 [Halioglobus sp.]
MTTDSFQVMPQYCPSPIVIRLRALANMCIMKIDVMVAKNAANRFQ